MRLDLGGIAKGYILDEALLMLGRHAVTRALIQAGGDIVAGDAPPGLRGWRVEVPGAGPVVRARAAALARAALSLSGDTEQFVIVDGVRYSHVVDPHTGVGLTSRRQAAVVATDGLTADGLSTALTVLEATRFVASRAPLPAQPVSRPASRSLATVCLTMACTPGRWCRCCCRPRHDSGSDRRSAPAASRSRP